MAAPQQQQQHVHTISNEEAEEEEFDLLPEDVFSLLRSVEQRHNLRQQGVIQAQQEPPLQEALVQPECDYAEEEADDEEQRRKSLTEDSFTLLPMSQVFSQSHADETDIGDGHKTDSSPHSIPSPLPHCFPLLPAPPSSSSASSSCSSSPVVGGVSSPLHGDGKREERGRQGDLASWGIPESVCETYAAKGVRSLYPWQIECLSCDGVLDGANLVYCAPTSAGKTLVAEILMLRMWLKVKKKALFILPFVSVVSEKVTYLRHMFESVDIHVEGFFANHGGTSLQRGEDDIDVAVCTIEKANSLINRLMEDNKIDDIGVIVIDEIHMMGDTERGYLLELLVTKLLYLNPNHLQIVGMSATIPNIDAFQSWLKASLYVTDCRPVPLVEYIKIGSNIYDTTLQRQRSISSPVASARVDPDHVVTLCAETIQQGHSVLIFCSTKRGCETTCQHVAQHLPSSLIAQHSDKLEARALVVAQLSKTPIGLDPVLEHSVLAGVAYHHAGLTTEEREIIEQAFRENVINVLTATSTLAAGVNLPARRVIFRTMSIGREPLDVTRYKQMSGRAGRTGIDSFGESYLLVTKHSEKELALKLTQSALPPLESCLNENRRGMIRPLLEVISNGVVETVYDIERYIQCTLFATQTSYDEVHRVSKRALSFLVRNEFITWSAADRKYRPSKLGKACVASSLAPEEGLVVFQELSRARSNFALDNELHLVYQVTPVFHAIEPDWAKFLQIYLKLNQGMKRVAHLTGVSEAFLMKASMQPPRYQDSSQMVRIHRRFYAALILNELVAEVPLTTLAEKYSAARGTLQNIAQNASTFAGMVTVFCHELGWWEMELLVSQFTDRLNFGAQMDILPLVQIPNVKNFQARALYDAGFRTVAAVAAASAEDIAACLRKALPFRSFQHDTALAAQQKVEERTARLLHLGAQNLLAQQMNALYQSARTMSSHYNAASQTPIANPRLLNVLPLSSRNAKSNTNRYTSPLRTPPLASLHSTTLPTVPLPTLINQDISKFKTPNTSPSKRRGGATTSPRRIGRAPSISSSSVVTHTQLQQPRNAQSKPGTESSEVAQAPTHLPLETGLPLATTEVPMKDETSVAGLLTSNQAPPAVVRDSSTTVVSSRASPRPPPSGAEAKPSSPKKRTESPTKEEDYRSVTAQKRPKELHQASLFAMGITAGVDKASGGAAFQRKGEELPFSLVMVQQTPPSATNEGRVSSTYPSMSLAEFRNLWNQASSFAWSLLYSYPLRANENRGRHPRVEGIAICWSSDKAYYLALHEQSAIDQQNEEPSPWTVLRTMLSQRNTQKICFDMLASLRILLDHGIRVEEKVLDPKVAAWMLDPEDTCETSLNNLVSKHVSSAKISGRPASNFERCCQDCIQSWILMKKLVDVLRADSLYPAFRDLEMALLPVLAAMERGGVGFVKESCKQHKDFILARMTALEKRAHEIVGRSFSLTSSMEVGVILFDELGLPYPLSSNNNNNNVANISNVAKTTEQGRKVGWGGGAANMCAKQKSRRVTIRYSTSKNILKAICHLHPVPKIILEHRKLASLVTKYIDVLPKYLCFNPRLQMHRIHASWLQTNTPTGRLVVKNPNLQCIPHTISFSSSTTTSATPTSRDGEPQQPMLDISMRDCFVAASGCVLLGADYSQLELRLMAHFSKDPLLLDILRAGGDLFLLIAAQWLGKDQEEVTKEERNRAKAMCYGILYGMGIHALAERLETTPEQAASFLDRFKQTYKGVTEFLAKTVQACQKKGYVETIGGRRRYFPEITSVNQNERKAAERCAINTICQGSAADLVKVAMINIHKRLASRWPSYLSANWFDGRGTSVSETPMEAPHLAIQIHDELVFEVPSELIEEVKAIVQHEMENAVSLLVPMKVAVSVGQTWGQMSPC
ncbi:Helicase and polymerase-containing protein TEBICHI [Balamuthia mandrillaris]